MLISFTSCFFLHYPLLHLAIVCVCVCVRAVCNIYNVCESILYIFNHLKTENVQHHNAPYSIAESNQIRQFRSYRFRSNRANNTFHGGNGNEQENTLYKLTKYKRMSNTSSSSNSSCPYI